MGKLSNLSTRDAIRAFQKAGFATFSQQGSHLKMRRIASDGKIQTIIIPNQKTLKEGNANTAQLCCCLGVIHRLILDSDYA